MRKILFSIVFLGLLTGCPNREEVNNTVNTIATKRNLAVKTLQAGDYSLEGLLQMQDYFFDFTEKVHLIKTETEAQKMVQSIIKRKNGARVFCDSFIFPLSYWAKLDSYCSRGDFYKCSPEIKEYKNTVVKLMQLVGDEAKRELSKESRCK